MKTCTDDAAQDPGNAARETALQGVQNGICLSDTKTQVWNREPSSACSYNNWDWRRVIYDEDYLNTKAEMVYGGQVTSGCCFATLNHIIGCNLIYCFASAFVEA